MTHAQVQELVAGRTTSWAQVPGSPRSDAIVPVALDRTTGARSVFESVFVDAATPSPTRPRTFLTAAQVRTFVEATPAAWGYVDVAFTDGLHVLRYDGVACDRATIRSGAYPARRPLGIVTRGRPRGPVARFLRWIAAQPQGAPGDRDAATSLSAADSPAGTPSDRDTRSPRFMSRRSARWCRPGVWTFRPTARCSRSRSARPAGACSTSASTRSTPTARSRRFRCECGLIACGMVLRMTADEYAECARAALHFAVHREHVHPETDRVVAANGAGSPSPQPPTPAAHGSPWCPRADHGCRAGARRRAPVGSPRTAG